MATKADIFDCLQTVFGDAGLNLNTITDIIVWADFGDPENLAAQLGDAVRNCIIGKGFQCEGLAPGFIQLRDAGEPQKVGDLVDRIALAVTP